MAASRQAVRVAAAVDADYRKREPKDVRVLVVGPTGYIGKFVVKELVSRGYNVVAFARENAGIKGKMGREDIVKVRHTREAGGGGGGGGGGQVEAGGGTIGRPGRARRVGRTGCGLLWLICNVHCCSVPRATNTLLLAPTTYPPTGPHAPTRTGVPWCGGAVRLCAGPRLAAGRGIQGPG